jgi:hypothetical protein
MWIMTGKNGSELITNFCIETALGVSDFSLKETGRQILRWEFKLEFETILSKCYFPGVKLAQIERLIEYNIPIPARFFFSSLIALKIEGLLPRNPKIQGPSIANRSSDQQVDRALNGFSRVVNHSGGFQINQTVRKRHL